ncbi:3'-5' exonuclease [Sulfurimonas lithotrophica]|uniref:3'-5' exonuclease n=1 Tax=Sulfurimonas lithotrophica TaxID=2590022 RepID=A0A5P8NYZ4_9BACT|nr:exonuclease domain-containing protein [Sulfurimonas lithotrophica]QFR48624.1 3'-5' exonuclease [Sulfurimonas lithotrophica]
MLIFLDTETTGLEKSDKIISIALIAVEEGETIFKEDLVNEGKKIPPKASSINHITNEMIKSKPALRESETFKFLELNNLYDTTLISHNANFDLEMLNTNAGFSWQGKIIDTLRTSKHLMSECEEFSLQYLRYELKLYKKEKEKIIPHDALSDVRVTKLLYETLLELASEDELEDLSTKNVLMQKFEFGKYAGRYIEEISMIDRGYLEWMLNNIMDLDEDLRYSIKYYL